MAGQLAPGNSDASMLESIAKIGIGIAAPELAVPMALASAAETSMQGGNPMMSLASAGMGMMGAGGLGDAANTAAMAGETIGAQGMPALADAASGVGTGMNAVADATSNPQNMNAFFAQLNGQGGVTTGAPLGAYAQNIASDANPIVANQVAPLAPAVPQVANAGITAPGTGAALSGGNVLNDTGAGITAPGTGAALNGGEPSTLDSIKDAWKNPWIKGGILGAGALGAYGLMSQDNKRFTTPSNAPYSGPLSQFSYNPNTYKPNYATPNVYKPTYAGGGTVEEMSNANALGSNELYPQAEVARQGYAEATNTPVPSNVLNPTGGSTVDPYTGAARLAKGGIAAAAPNHMQAIDDYIASASKEGGMQALMAKAQGGDYNAMLALNKLQSTPNQNYAAGGGVGHLGSYSDGGRMLKGPGDGMSDDIPASISGKQPARLADSEFVVPADVVSHLGNGSSDAGAKKLYAMMDNVRKARTGSKKQGKQIDADKYLAK